MDKSLIQTKTFWSGVAAIATGVGLFMSGQKAEGLLAVMLAVQGIFQRAGTQKAELASGKQQ